MVEAVAARYDFDGYGWQYIDSGSGSDWLTRHPDAEPLYGPEALAERNEGVEQETCGHCGAKVMLLDPAFIDRIKEALDRIGAPTEVDGKRIYGLIERIEALAERDALIAELREEIADLRYDASMALESKS